MIEKPKILLVEDDPNLGFVTSDQLSQKGFEVVRELNGTDGWSTFQTTSFDLCLIDIMMPEMDGFTLVKKIRSSDTTVPIIFLTARSMQEDKLRGFEIGADDYVTKPFSTDELAYRIQVFLRRSSSIGMENKVHQATALGQMTFDYRNLWLSFPNQTFKLTQREADVMNILLNNTGKLVKREDLLIEIWGENDYFKGRSLDVFIFRLRKYLECDNSLEIRNHHGVGFCLLHHDFSS